MALCRRRFAIARNYDVSRAHVTAIIARAERSGMLSRDGNEVVLTDATSTHVLHDLACQLAIVIAVAAEKPTT